jgi:parallel beta-helix repeat protein
VAAPPASAADCGGDVPCSCGDTIVASRTLDPSTDPVLFDTVRQPGDTPCTGDGLLVGQSGITVNFKGNRIRGDKIAGHTGIKILDGVDNVDLAFGRVVQFAAGLATVGTTSGSSIQNLSFQDLTGDAIHIAGDGNAIVNVKTTKNDGHGIHVTGNANTLERTANQGNDLSGITIVGDGNELTSNRANNNGAGILVTGTGNALAKNLAQHNDGDGILVQGGGNDDDGKNRARNNGGVQCAIDASPCL